MTLSSPGRRRDRRVYLRSHPFLFALLAAARRMPVLRLGRTVLVNGTEAYLQALTEIALDRSAAGTTGGNARRLTGGDLLFDQEDAAHRRARRELSHVFNSAGVARTRPLWADVLRRRLAPLATGETIDLVDVAAELAGVATVSLIGLNTDPHSVSVAARTAAAAAVRAELPGPRGPGRERATRAAVDRLTGALAGAAVDPALASMIAVAAVNTTVAAIPRAVAWCADDRLWSHAADPELLPTLVAELLRVTAPSPVLPRAVAAPGEIGGCPVRSGDRLILVARHAAYAHEMGPDPVAPMTPRISQLVFGAGTHSCPGAGLARAQLADTLAALAPYRPVVVSARADRRAALPSWATLRVRAVSR
ncbi:cytochrome P450 [Micromonospora sp. 15K316]|uniref:cytochrome P450 n=1 Tax=Micromonospora sp. 15K316 TaxID=2530376 RepID=UPI0010464353|nr:cytochrome P450 [Micromonospora sp. 15K316]TDC39165.1 cytochrome P450 [Micromonospora sp. 15K316]